MKPPYYSISLSLIWRGGYINLTFMLLKSPLFVPLIPWVYLRTLTEMSEKVWEQYKISYLFLSEMLHYSVLSLPSLWLPRRWESTERFLFVLWYTCSMLFYFFLFDASVKRNDTATNNNALLCFSLIFFFFFFFCSEGFAWSLMLVSWLRQILITSR